LEVYPQHGALGFSSATNRVGIRLQRFAIESILILVGYSCLWYVLWSAPASDSTLRRFLRGLFLPFSLPTMLWIDLTIFSFFALVFYGTASEITPLRLLTVIFQPLVSFYRKRSLRTVMEVEVERREDSPTAERPADLKLPAAQAIETPVVEVEEKENENAIPGIEALSANVGSDDEEQPDDLFREVSVRASFLATRMEKRTNTYMILGVAMGFIGMFFWFWTFNSSLAKQMSVTEFVESAIPRITILLFIELLAGFFLRQYRIGVEDFKYFYEIEQKANWKRIGYSILAKVKSDTALLSFASALTNDTGPTKLSAGESTPTLEVLKAEGNIALEAMKLMGSTIQEVAKGIKQKS
jgi:hypothetical protein